MIEVKVNKVDPQLRMVFGWGSICKKRNPETGQLEIYTDTDNEQFPEDVTLKAWLDFMNGAYVEASGRAGGRTEP